MITPEANLILVSKSASNLNTHLQSLFAIEQLLRYHQMGDGVMTHVSAKGLAQLIALAHDAISEEQEFIAEVSRDCYRQISGKKMPPIA